MTDDTKIMLINMTTGSLSVNIPDLRYKRRWEKKGAKKPMPWGVLKEAIYDPGFEYMIQQGMLFIDDKDARIELELEDGDTHVQKDGLCYLGTPQLGHISEHWY